MPEKIRAFLALPLYALQEEISWLVRSAKADLPSIRWTPPEQVHVTLHFFGDVDPSQVPKIEKLALHVAARYSLLELQLNGIGFFPDISKPKIIWVGLEDSRKSLIKFQRDLVTELKVAGFEVDDRPFQAHATIGRVKAPVSEKDLENLRQLKSGGDPRALISHFILYRSYLSPEGPRYEILKKFYFGQKPAA